MSQPPVTVLVVVDWTLRCLTLFTNIWLSIAMQRSGEVKKIYIFLMIYCLIYHDIICGFINIFHDIPSYFTEYSILITSPIPYEILVAFLSIQWFFAMLFLPVFSLMHFFALFFPFAFRRIRTRSILGIICILYVLTFIIMIPLFTPYCGFVWHGDGKYWSSDSITPYNWLYLAMNYWLQFVCLGTMISANIAILIKLYIFRQKNIINHQTVAASISSKGPTHEPPAYEMSRRNVLSPEARLSISFIMLSGCFFVSTLSFNLFLGRTDPVFGSVRLICSYMNILKWIIYCLGNKKIRKTFFSPSAVCGRS